MELDYKNKNILAPMVRVGQLAFRLLALEYGADLVYTEEIIDYKMVNARRSVNEFNGTIDYLIDGAQKPIFQTNDTEKGKVIFQMGTCNPERALKVCKLIENDVAAIDINMGCPKDFSVKSGMGSALLSKPDLIKEILTTLVQGCSKPITCKIRCLPSLEDTINLCKMIESCGVKALGVHGRFQQERSTNPPHNDYIKAISEALTIPVIANGGSNTVVEYKDIAAFKEECGVSSMMLARAAMWNCSVFRKEGLIELDTVIKRYLEICCDVDQFFYNTKYTVQQMLHNELTSERGVTVLASNEAKEIYSLFEMTDFYEKFLQRKDTRISKEIVVTKRKVSESDDVQNNEQKKVKSEEFSDAVDVKNIITKHAKYVKSKFNSIDTPKSILHGYTMKMNWPKPVYKTEEKRPERVYKSMVEVNNVLYGTPYWEVNKQATEQAVAIVCLEVLGVDYSVKMKKD